MTKQILSTIAAILPVIAGAQAIIPPPPRPRPPIPPFPPIVIKVPENTTSMPIQVKNVDIQANVTGVLAETSVTMTFFNPNNRTLEAELSFPLPTDAMVSGYALDVNGKLIDGVIVPKDKARVVFDELVRQGIDPGLVEQSAGNTFKTRIYPLTANGTRTIKLNYVSTVDIIKEDVGRASYYVQPLRFPNKLESFKLKLNVAAAQQPPKVVAGNLTGLDFTNWQSIYTASTELKDIELTEDLYVAIMTRPEETFAIQKASDGKAYATYHRILDIAEFGKDAANQAKRRPCILWDASLSRSKSDHTAEFELMKLALKDASSIDLIIFRNEPEKLVTVSSFSELLKRIGEAAYDGGTSVSRALAAIPDNADAWLFSDGLDNLSPEAAIRAGNCRLSAFFTDKDQNAPFLRGLAAKSGGVCADLRSTPPEDAAKLLASAVPIVSNILVNGKNMSDSLVWQIKGDRLAVAGPVPEDANDIVVTVSFGGSKKVFQCKNAEKNLDGKLLKTFFGQMTITQLIESSASEKEMVAASREYNLVTPATSMMVLDNLEQYLKYGIRPPETLPEMRAQYDKQHKDDPKDDDGFNLKPNSLQSVVNMWNVVVTWHKHDFPHTMAVTQTKKTRENEDGFFSRIAQAVTGGARRNAPGDGRARQMNVEDGVGVAAEADNDAVEVTREAAPAPMAAGAAREANSEAAAPTPSGPKTAIQAWKPDTPYLKELESHKDNAYETYLAQRKTYGDAPGFFMDCTDFFVAAGQKELAIRILTNIAEMELENKALLRILAYKLRFLGELELAETVFRKVLVIAREEPQSYRDLALTLDDQEKFQEAVDTMMTIINFKFDNRFPEIENIALTEINRFIARAKRKGVTIKNVDEKLIHLVDTDIRVVLNWDADMTDMDLWTIDPYGVKCYYGYRHTPTGGYNSCDFTQGYGPEAFMIRDAVKGNYTIQANYYGSHSQKVLGPVTLDTEVFTNYGRPDEKKEVLTYRLTTAKEVVTVGTVSHDGVNRPQHHDAPFQYQVKTGDTLASIAKQQLGDESRIPEILKLNPTIKDPEKLKVGTIITLPATK